MKQPEIEKTITIQGSSFFRHENDPFRLYQSYIEIVKPLDYEHDLKYLEHENKLLKEMLEEANNKADSIKKACESYLSEEA